MSGPYFETGYVDVNYFENIQQTSAALTATVSFTATVDIANTANYFIPDYIEEGYFQTPVKEGAAALTVTVTQSTDIIRNRLATVNITGAFTPTLTASVFKNQTAVLDNLFAFSLTASRIASNQSTLNHIVTLSLQGDRSRIFDSTLLASFTQSTQIERIRNISSTQNTQFTITADANILNSATEASATLTAEFTQSTQTSKLAATTVNLNTEFTVSVTAQRFRGIEKTFIGEVTIFTEIGKLQLGACDFATLFTPTVVCVALKNHTAVLDVVSVVSCAITKTTAFTVTLNTEFGLNVNIVRSRVISATVNSVFTQSVGVGKTVDSASTFNTAFSITNQNPAVSPNFFVGTLETAQSSISSQFSLNITFITWKSKWYGTPRPLTWIKTASALFVANRLQLPSSEQLAYSDSQKTGSNNWFTIGTNDFTLEFVMLITNVNNLPTQGNESSNTIPFVVAVNPSISGFNYSSSTSYQNFSDFNFGFSRSQFTIGYDKTLQKITAYFGSTEIGTSFTPTNNDWIYVCLGRQNGQIKLTLNNTTTNGFSYVGNGSIGNFRSLLLINSRLSPTSGKDVYFDSVQFKIGEYAPSFNTSLADAVGTENTKVIGNFNNNLDDTLTSQLIAVSSITATATVTALAGKSTTAQATLNTQFTVTTQVGEIEPADITMNTVSSLVIVATRIKTFTASMNAETTQSVSVTKITGYTATISSVVTINCDITRIKQFTTEFSAIATELAVVSKIGQGLLTLDVVAQITAVINRTAAAESNLLTQFGITAQGDRTRFGTASTAVEFSLNAVNSRIRALNSSLDAEFAVTASNSRIRGTQSTQNSAFSIICEPLPIKRAISNQSAQFVQTTIEERIRSTSVTFNTNFTQQSTGIIAVDAVADLNSEALCTITVLRIRPGVVQMDAIAVNLTAAAKTGAGLVTIESQSQCTVTAQKTTDIQLNAASTAQFTSIIERIQQGVGNIQSTFTQTANGVLNTDVVANINTLFSTTMTAQKTVRANANISSAGGFVMAVAAIRNGEILLNTQAAITTTADRIRGTGAGLNNSFTVIALAGKAAVAQCAMNVTVTHNITAGVLRLDDIVLYIKTETRSYSINNEQRSYALRQENRLYTIEE